MPLILILQVFGGATSDPWMTLFTILGFTMIGLGFLGSPQIYVRFISVKNSNEIDRGKWVAVLFTLITDTAAVSIGLLGRYLFTTMGQDPESILGVGGEDVLLKMIENLLPLTIVAIYIAIVLSAIMSTIDSLIIVASSAITRDYYQQIKKPNISEKSLTKISRYVTLGIALLSLIIALIVAWATPDRTIFWFVIFGFSGIAATFCPVIILSLFWRSYSEAGAIASMLSGCICVPIFKFVFQNMEDIGKYFEKLDVLAPSFAISIFFGWVFTKLFPSKSEKI